MSIKLITPILITGSTGFIGSNLVRQLIKKYDDIHIIIRKDSNLWRINDIIGKVNIHYVDLVEKSAVVKAVEKIKPQTIFHLAAYGAYPFQNNVEKIKSVILDGTINLIEACLKNKFKIFINTGSNSEYGFKNSPMKESDILCPNSHYAVMKAATTNYCQFIAASQKLPIVTVRPFHIYGPYEEPSRLIPKLVTKLLDNELPKLVSPNIARDMLYIDDAIDLFCSIASIKVNNGEIFNMGSGSQSTIRMIVDNTIGLIGASIIPKWNSMKPRIWDQYTWVSDMTKVKRILGWQPRYTLSEGLFRTIKWYIDNPEIHQ
jgi:nucleoside-diphosphate-sugar epimerase